MQRKCVRLGPVHETCGQLLLKFWWTETQLSRALAGILATIAIQRVEAVASLGSEADPQPATLGRHRRLAFSRRPFSEPSMHTVECSAIRLSNPAVRSVTRIHASMLKCMHDNSWQRLYHKIAVPRALFVSQPPPP